MVQAVSPQAWAPLTAGLTGVAVILSSVALLPLLGASKLPIYVLAITIPAMVIVTILSCVRQSEAPDDQHFVLGFLYYNPANPALMVPKRFGFGWTFNMAHHAAWVFLGMLLSVPLLTFWLIR